MHVRRLGSVLVRTQSLSPTMCRPYCYRHPECQPSPRNPFFDPGYEESVRGPRPRCVIGGKNRVTIINGLGVGPELMAVVQQVFLWANAPIDFEVLDLDENCEDGDVKNAIYSVERNGVCLKGNINLEQSPDEPIPRSFRIKRALDLYAQVTEVKSYPALAENTRLKAYVDVVLICPNSEGVAALLEHDNGQGVENLRVTTEYNTRRVAEFAFDYAVKNKRRRVTLVYNKGVMNWAEGTIIEAVSKVASNYSQIQFNKQSMKTFMFKLKHFEFNGDVIVTMPLYGGIIRNILFSMMHATGLYCVQNIGSRHAVFEPAARNKGVKMVGKDEANPVALLDAGVKMLRHLGHQRTADVIQGAVELTVNTDRVHTRDMLGDASTSAMVAAIRRRIHEQMPEGYRDATVAPALE